MLCDFHRRYYGECEVSRIPETLARPLGLDWAFDLAALKRRDDDDLAEELERIGKK